jgi:hypothetical protein
MAFKNLTDWARSNLKKSEILEMIEELQALVKSPKDGGGAEDDDPAVDPEARRNPTYLNLLGEDRSLRYSANIGMDRLPGGGRVNTAKAEAEFMKMFPDARRLKA